MVNKLWNCRAKTHSSPTGFHVGYNTAFQLFKAYYFSISYKHPSSPLVDGLSRDQIPVQARFSATIPTSPGPHPASYTMGTRSFPWVKWRMHGVKQLPPSSTKIKDKGQLYLYSSSVPSWQVTQYTSHSLHILFYGWNGEWAADISYIIFNSTHQSKLYGSVLEYAMEPWFQMSV